MSKLSAVAVRRLTKLADFLDTIPTTVFDIRKWLSAGRYGYGHADKLGARAYFKGDIAPEVMQECGTTACALGWACTIPEFRKAGLRMGIQEGFRILGKLSATTPRLRSSTCLHWPENVCTSPCGCSLRVRTRTRKLAIQRRSPHASVS